MSEPRKRPGRVTGAAVMLFIFGGFTLLGGVCGGGLIAMLAVTPPAQKNAKGQINPKDQFAQQRMLVEEVPGYVPAMVGFGLVGLGLGIAKVYAGFGLLKMKPSARTLTILAAWCSIALNLIHTAYTWVMEKPVNDRFFDLQAAMMAAEMGGQPPPFDMGGMMKGMMIGVVILSVVFHTAIWLIVIYLVSGQAVRDAFAGKYPDEPAPAVDERIARYDGYDDDDQARPLPPPRSPGDTGITDRPS